METLEEMLEKFEVVVNERRDEASHSKAETEERARKLEQYRDMLLADGIDPNELFNALSESKRLAKPNVLPALPNISLLMKTGRPKPDWSGTYTSSNQKSHGTTW